MWFAHLHETMGERQTWTHSVSFNVFRARKCSSHIRNKLQCWERIDWWNKYINLSYLQQQPFILMSFFCLFVCYISLWPVHLTMSLIGVGGIHFVHFVWKKSEMMRQTPFCVSATRVWSREPGWTLRGHRQRKLTIALIAIVFESNAILNFLPSIFLRWRSFFYWALALRWEMQNTFRYQKNRYRKKY